MTAPEVLAACRQRMVRKQSRALTAAQMLAVLAELPSPAKEMVFLAANNSLNVAELAALTWEHLNLTAEYALLDGEAFEPYSVGVRRNYYCGQISSTKANARRRTLPLSAPMVAMLARWREASSHAKPGDYVFANRKGGPADEHNLRVRVLKPAGARAGIPFPIGWHIFRHTCATLATHVGMDHADRKALLGHSSDAMTLLYTHSDSERRRAAVEKISLLLLTAKGEV